MPVGFGSSGDEGLPMLHATANPTVAATENLVRMESQVSKRNTCSVPRLSRVNSGDRGGRAVVQVNANRVTSRRPGSRFLHAPREGPLLRSPHRALDPTAR